MQTSGIIKIDNNEFLTVRECVISRETLSWPQFLPFLLQKKNCPLLMEDNYSAVGRQTGAEIIRNAWQGKGHATQRRNKGSIWSAQILNCHQAALRMIRFFFFCFFFWERQRARMPFPLPKGKLAPWPDILHSLTALHWHAWQAFSS